SSVNQLALIVCRLESVKVVHVDVLLGVLPVGQQKGDRLRGQRKRSQAAPLWSLHHLRQEVALSEVALHLRPRARRSTEVGTNTLPLTVSAPKILTDRNGFAGVAT